MAEIILHHFDSSPFAEKVRLALGLKNLDWRSVEIPMVMPKPALTALTGGYRTNRMDRRWDRPSLRQPGALP